MNIYWFRRDLRLEDNHALYEILKQSNTVLPIFIFDPSILDTLPRNDRRVTFLVETVQQIQKLLVEMNKTFWVFYGKPKDVFLYLLQNYPIQSIYCNHDYEPQAIERDKEIELLAQRFGISFFSFKDHVIFEKREVTKQEGTLFKVFTPYSNQWKKLLSQQGIYTFDSFPYLFNIISATEIINKEVTVSIKLFRNISEWAIADIGFTSNIFTIEPYLVAINNYESVRDYPSLNTTKVSVALRFGTISIRKLVLMAQTSNEKYLNELIWREFYSMLLYNFPHTVTQPYNNKYQSLVYDDATDLLNLWKEGQTGYPLIDAGMIELKTTGNMHNRVRMLTASFLTKLLWIDWRLGERYFAQQLLDFDLASNVGNWQWVAGVGCDAAPYFRIFNPSIQHQKYDSKHEYIKKWIPNYSNHTYIKPCINYEESRIRALEKFKAYLK